MSEASRNSGVVRGFQWLNAQAPVDAVAELLKCCGSTKWAKRLVELRPFHTLEELSIKAKEVWWSLAADDWLEAFQSHPKIGEKKGAHEGSAQAREWSDQEQSAVDKGGEETVRALSELNKQYEAKFGYIFIVCATGKSAEQMLAKLRRRLTNDHTKELLVAAAEQEKITELRLRKLLERTQ